MSSPIRFVLAAGAAVAIFFAGFWFRGRNPVAPAPAPAARRVLYWHDPMHPAYKSDKPGIAPDCGMQLEPVYADEEPGSVRITPERQQLIGVRLGQVVRSSPGQTLRVSGRVAVDETRVYRLLASVDGWIREISPYAVGNIVKKDELLASYFSRDLLTPQQSYIYALNTRDQMVQGGDPGPGQTRVIDSQVRNAEEGLQTLGMSEYQIREVAKNRSAASIMQVRAPANGIILTRNVSRGLRVDRSVELYRMADLTRVWVLADVQEREAKVIALGGRARVRYRDQVFPADIADALPPFDPVTRTLKVRLDLDNPGYGLRPDMFVDVEMPVRLPAALTVPADAVIDSGRRKIVYVDRGNGLFEPRPVETGWQFGDVVAITKGLEAGERIVVSGNFLIDSESRMRLGPEGKAWP
jgi:multidrug efflux pump subunit AcrA (membrane-fusion protein)